MNLEDLRSTDEIVMEELQEMTENIKNHLIDFGRENSINDKLYELLGGREDYRAR